MTEVTDFNDKIIAEFRASGGKAGGQFAGADILLLHHTGARTGTERVSPLAYQRVAESFALFASKAGAPANAGSMIAKTFFLAKIIHRILTRSLRGKKSLHETLPKYRTFSVLPGKSPKVGFAPGGIPRQAGFHARQGSAPGRVK